MKQMKMLKIMTVFAFMAVLVCMNSFTVEVDSKKEKALKAYDKMLSKSLFKVKTCAMSEGEIVIKEYQTANCSFAVVDIDKDSVPELIVEDVRDADHASGYGAMFIYKNGKVKQATALNLNGTFKYYKKEGVIVDNYTNEGYSYNSYKKLSNGKVTQFISTEKNFGNLTGSKKTKYYDADGNKISKSTFNKALEKYAKSLKPTEVKFLDNTATNRAKYLKQKS